MLAGALAGLDVRVATPPGYEPDGEVVTEARSLAQRHRAWISVGTDAAEAVRGADAVYTDVWASMGREAEADERVRASPATGSTRRSSPARAPHVVAMHCMPATAARISAAVLDGPRSVAGAGREPPLRPGGPPDRAAQRPLTSSTRAVAATGIRRLTSRTARSASSTSNARTSRTGSHTIPNQIRALSNPWPMPTSDARRCSPAHRHPTSRPPRRRAPRPGSASRPASTGLQRPRCPAAERSAARSRREPGRGATWRGCPPLRALDERAVRRLEASRFAIRASRSMIWRVTSDSRVDGDDLALERAQALECLVERGGRDPQRQGRALVRRAGLRAADVAADLQRERPHVADGRADVGHLDAYLAGLDDALLDGRGKALFGRWAAALVAGGLIATHAGGGLAVPPARRSVPTLANWPCEPQATARTAARAIARPTAHRWMIVRGDIPRVPPSCARRTPRLRNRSVSGVPRSARIGFMDERTAGCWRTSIRAHRWRPASSTTSSCPRTSPRSAARRACSARSARPSSAPRTDWSAPWPS